MVLGDSPLRVPEKLPVPFPRASIFEDKVGLALVLQTIPTADIFAPPSAVIWPPTVAEVGVMEFGAFVAIVASAAPVQIGVPSWERTRACPGNPGDSLTQAVPFQ